MGCLCPHNIFSHPSALQQQNCGGKRSVNQKQDMVLESQRKKIIFQPEDKIDVFQHDMFSTIQYSEHSSKNIPEENKTSTQKRPTSQKTQNQKSIITKIGQAKSQRTITIINSQSDINKSNNTINHSVIHEIITVSKDFIKKQKLKKFYRRYYCLIEGKIFVKKELFSIMKIKSVGSSYSIFCSLQTVKQVIHLTLGIPIQNIQILSLKPFSYLVLDNFPLTITINFKCTLCQTQKIKISSSCKIKYESKCKCGSSTFNITNIQTFPLDIPIWKNSSKLFLGDNVKYIIGTELRAIGCNTCWKFEKCRRMDCGCLKCLSCCEQYQNDFCLLCY